MSIFDILTGSMWSGFCTVHETSAQYSIQSSKRLHEHSQPKTRGEKSSAFHPEIGSESGYRIRRPGTITSDSAACWRAGRIAVDDNAVKAVVYRHQQLAKQLGEQFHRSSRRLFSSSVNSIGKKRTFAQGLMPMTQAKNRRGVASKQLPQQSLRIAKEVRYIQHRAAERDGRIVNIGPLVLFSTQTGDAWILDPADQLAARLAYDGDPLALYIEETDINYAIGWQGGYRIDNDTFVYEDNAASNCNPRLSNATIASRNRNSKPSIAAGVRR